VESDFGTLCALIPENSTVNLHKLERQGTFHPLAVATASSTVAIKTSVENGQKNIREPSSFIFSVYEAIQQSPPPYLVAPSAPPKIDEDLCCDGECEPARIVDGTESGQTFGICHSHKIGKLLGSVKVVMLIKRT